MFLNSVLPNIINMKNNNFFIWTHPTKQKYKLKSATHLSLMKQHPTNLTQHDPRKQNFSYSLTAMWLIYRTFMDEINVILFLFENNISLFCREETLSPEGFSTSIVEFFFKSLIIVWIY